MTLQEKDLINHLIVIMELTTVTALEEDTIIILVMVIMDLEAKVGSLVIIIVIPMDIQDRIITVVIIIL